MIWPCVHLALQDLFSKRKMARHRTKSQRKYGPGVRGHALPPQDLSVNLKEFLSNSFCFCCFHLHGRVLTVAIIMFTKMTNSTNAVSGRPTHFLAPLLLAPLPSLPSSSPFSASLLLFRVKDSFQLKLAILYQMNVFCKKTQNTT